MKRLVFSQEDNFSIRVSTHSTKLNINNIVLLKNTLHIELSFRVVDFYFVFIQQYKRISQ